MICAIPNIVEIEPKFHKFTFTNPSTLLKNNIPAIHLKAIDCSIGGDRLSCSFPIQFFDFFTWWHSLEGYKTNIKINEETFSGVWPSTIFESYRYDSERHFLVDFCYDYRVEFPCGLLLGAPEIANIRNSYNSFEQLQFSKDEDVVQAYKEVVELTRGIY